MIFSSFLNKPPKTRYNGEDEDEQILYVIRASTLTTIPWLLLTAVFIAVPFYAVPALASIEHEGIKLVNGQFLFFSTLFWYLATAGFAFQCFINWFFNVYVITTKKILDFDFRGLIYKNISETTLDNVEDVTSNVKGTLGVVFNIGNVLIQTAGEAQEFEFSQVSDPAKIRDIIADLVVKARHGHHNFNNN